MGVGGEEWEALALIERIKWTSGTHTVCHVRRSCRLSKGS